MKAVRIFLKRHWKLCIVLAILLYLIVGMLAPFAVQKKIGPEENLLHKEDFYASGNEKCVDRAHVVEENAEALDLRLRMIKDCLLYTSLQTHFSLDCCIREAGDGNRTHVSSLEG